ncbi:MAG: isochorismate synthase [Actinomycetota bacterium]|nr:isochorismate synthase [Actinomycetota bacterium]
MPPPVLDRAGLATLIEGAVRRAAGRKRDTVVSVTVPASCDDPAAVAFGSRQGGEPWFCWEQPDREFALAAIGRAHSVRSRGKERFREVAAECAHLSGDAIVVDTTAGEEGDGAAATVWTGGFAFADEGGTESAWSSFEPAEMTLPEVAIRSDRGSVSLTVNALVTPATDTEALTSRLAARVGSLVAAEIGMIDPHPAVPPVIEGVRTPERFEQSVAAAVERIRAGEIEKVVLAREIVVRSGTAHDPAAIFDALRTGFPSCFNFCVGTGEAAFVGASPELLVRCTGRGVATVGLAGSTRRSSDPAVDDHLAQKLMGSAKDRGEQDLVVKRIVKALSRISIWVEAAGEPEIIKVANIQHLGTPVYAQLGEPRTAIELASLLHPTPAVGGEPWGRAETVMAEVEDMDRGWYAGPVGWMDGSGDGEFCVALRSALIRDREAHLYAGVGVVADSDPAAELAETEIKLGALLPLIGE